MICLYRFRLLGTCSHHEAPLRQMARELMFVSGCLNLVILKEEEAKEARREAKDPPVPRQGTANANREESQRSLQDTIDLKVTGKVNAANRAVS